jgi:hypothetical protein
LARSQRGDHRVIAAVLRIEQENADADADAAATVPPPAIIPSSDSGDVADASPAYFEVAPVSSEVTGKAIVSSKRGRAIIKKLMRPFFKLQKRRGAPRPKRASVKPFARKRATARATHSHASHGGARKAAADDGGDGGDGDGGKPPSRRRRKPERKRRGPRQIEVGWTRFYRFPSSMGRKVAPGECNFASSPALQVAVIGPKHDQQTGSIRTVRSVSSGKVTTVVLGALVETHESVPISFYTFRRISPAPRESVGPSAPEAIAVRS